MQLVTLRTFQASRCLHTPTAVSAMFYCSPHQTSISRCLSSSKLPTRVSNTSGDAPNFVVDRVGSSRVCWPQISTKSTARVAAAKRSHGAVVRPKDECVTATDLVAGIICSTSSTLQWYFSFTFMPGYVKKKAIMHIFDTANIYH